ESNESVLRAESEGQEKPWLPPENKGRVLPLYIMVLIGVAATLMLCAVGTGLVSAATSYMLEDRLATNVLDDAELVFQNDAIETEQNRATPHFLPADYIVPFRLVGYAVQMGQDGWMATIYAELPDHVTLPAFVALAVPAGTDVLWVGETDGDNELQRTAEIHVEEGYEIYTLELTRYRGMQLEYKLPDVRTQPVSGYPAILTAYRPYTDVDTLISMVTIPENATLISRATYLETVEGEGTIYFVSTHSLVSGGLHTRQFVYTVDERQSSE
ncbi:MAG: hypothetical protein FWE48_07285, partial [Coriobacteriia bacterium]|nr:hypothetical protein [Coriobacteriia bacterium]